MIKELKGYPNYLVSDEGKVYKVTKNGTIKERAISVENTYGFSRVNVVDKDGKAGARLLHRLVYKSFRGDYAGDLVFIDGDKQNCRLDNLITVKELLDFYNRHKVIEG